MKFDGVKKVDEGRFISRYDLYYTTEDDKKKVYEIISRNKDIKTLEDIRNEKTDGVVIVATDEADEHIQIMCIIFQQGLLMKGKLPKWRRSVSLRKRQGLTLL